MKKDQNELLQEFAESRPGKIIIYSALALAALFLAGKASKILAGAIRGFKELKSAIKE